jgi:hypothetical protein
MIEANLPSACVFEIGTCVDHDAGGAQCAASKGLANGMLAGRPTPPEMLSLSERLFENKGNASSDWSILLRSHFQC